MHAALVGRQDVGVRGMRSGRQRWFAECSHVYPLGEDLGDLLNAIAARLA
jgi:hypothetical protein